jgi:hypothetical protein
MVIGKTPKNSDTIKLDKPLQPQCQKVAYEVNSLPADLLTIATQGLVDAKYWGSTILLCAYPSQRGIQAGFRCLTG